MAITPCEQELQLADRTTELNKQSSTDQHSNDINCNGFCNCSQCAFAVIIPKIVRFIVADNHILKHIVLSNNSVIDISKSIWQPPQLS